MLKKVFSILILSLFLSSCTVKIKTIFSEIDKYDQKEVTIKGKVESPTNIVIAKYYFINDNSGKTLRVVTENELPKEGEIIKVHGTVKQRFKVGEFQWVVLKQTPKQDEK